MTAKRAPKHMGTGIYVHQQFEHRKHELVKGDTFNDADFGDMVWNGKKWISEDDWNEKEWLRIGRLYFKYAAETALSGKKPIALLEYLIKYYHSPKRNHIK